MKAPRYQQVLAHRHGTDLDPSQPATRDRIQVVSPALYRRREIDCEDVPERFWNPA